MAGVMNRDGKSAAGRWARRDRRSSPGGVINLRISAEQRALIDRAADRLGKSRTEFMLDSARRAAENALLDQRLFLLDSAGYRKLAACLDKAVEPPDALRKLLSTRSPWER